MTSIPLVIELTRSRTLVQLPDSYSGKIQSVTLTDWFIEPDVHPFFQVRFFHGLEVKCLSYGKGVRSDSIQVPWTSLGSSSTPKVVPVVRESMIPRVFQVDLFDSQGNEVNPTRCVLWFIIVVSNIF